MADPDTTEEEPTSSKVAEAEVRERRRISLVWLVPVVAALIGGWLAYRAFTERGPEVTIRFASAAGLEAGKTKVKYKDVEVGQVQSIVLSADLRGVEVRARLVAGTERLLTEQTRFWVVRPRVSAGRVSGLGTLLSGAYIGIDPVIEGTATREFVGLESPPAFTSDEAGRVFELRADSLGSIEIGAPVLFRWITVGEIVGYQLDESGEYVNVQIFVRAPHDARIRTSTLFWNASGLDVTLSPEGFQLDTVSLTSLLIGGVAFETPTGAEGAAPVPDGFVFPLYPSRRATTKPAITLARPFLLHFEQSVAGLVPGSPVEFRGIQIGEVRDVRMEFAEDMITPRIPVLIDIQPQRIGVETPEGEALRRRWERLVAQGLRAQLKSHSLLTGQLAVSFDFYPDAPPAEISWEGPVPELPTQPGSVEQLMAGVTRFVDRLGDVPLEAIGKEVRASLRDLRVVLSSLEDATPALTATLGNAERTLGSANALIAPDSQTSQDLRRALRELADAARSLRLLAEELEQRPESLIRGKETGR